MVALPPLPRRVKEVKEVEGLEIDPGYHRFPA